ncbi:MAG TPA: protein kinase [Candidatus Acidoferrales bacterium]|nr:protein kinase [Candidatus Acidoferrales bacterium]
MICPHCRTENADEISACTKCGSSFDLQIDADETLDSSMPTFGSEKEGSSPTPKSPSRAASSARGSAAASRTGPRSSVGVYGVLEPGNELGERYRIEGLLGQGGMGRVYKAYDKELDRTVALKVLQPELTTDANAMQRFKQELLLASRISHKHILRIHDLGEADGVKFISMAYVEGKDLHHLLREEGKLPTERAQKIAEQLCEALDAAHSEGVVHRDLKPQNVLMGKNDHVYVSDFGLAKSLESSTSGMTRAGQYLGTPKYMAPEQVEAKPVDNRTDLYALGLILYEMVTGEEAFKGDSTLQIMYRRVKEKPPNPKQVNPELPDNLTRVILRCLERDPARRYPSAKEILADLQSGRATPAGRSVQIALPEVGKRWWYAAAGVMAILIAMVAIPAVRHMIFPNRPGSSGSAPPQGVPPLSSGRFVAVLPLQIVGDQSQLGYVAQGIEEALSAKLFQLKDIRVTSPDEAGKANQKQSLPKIARALGANLLVQGMLQGSGDKIRIDVNLEDVADGKQLWSKEFNGVTGDLFTLEDQIYNQLVSALNVNPTNEELAKAEARPTDNVAAYDLYLRGRNALRGHDSKSIEAGLNYFSQALKQDGSFALAYSGIADASLRMYVIKKDSFWTQKALAAAQQADQLNDKLPEVHTTLGSVYNATGKYAEAVAELRRALTLAPSSDEAYRRLGDAYLLSGNGAQAIAAFQKAILLNPYYWGNQEGLGGAYFQLGDYAKALESFRQVTVLEPDIDAGYENMGNVYLQEGKYQECIPYFQHALQIEPYWTTYSNLGMAYFYLKQYRDSAGMFEKAVALNPNDAQAVVNLADAYRWSGQQDKARASYQQAISLGYKELEINPQSASAMAQMALSYAKIGEAQQADNFIRRARSIDKSNVNYIYFEAEVDAILNRPADALKALREAFEKHFPVEFAAGEPDLGNLQKNPEFAGLLKQYAKKKTRP